MIMKNGQTHYIKPRIIFLGSQRKTLKQRYEQRLKELDYKPWAKDAPNQPNTCVDFVISGDHDRMTEIAFGKPMDFDWREDNSSVTLADDPNHPGYKQIETLALEYYKFLCRKFGEENVLGLECHLDETTPHFHALVVPVAERKPQGRTGGYDLDPDIEPDGKERPKHIITRQYERLTEEEKRFYKPAVKKKVPMVSYAHYFGKTKYQAYTSYKHWHTMLYEEVNSKWGLARGEDTSLMTPEERKEHRKKSKRKLEQERLEALRKADEAEQKAESATKEYAIIQDKLQQAGRIQSLVEDDIREGRKQVAKIVTQVETARIDLSDARAEKDKVQKEKTVLEQRVEELVNAGGEAQREVLHGQLPLPLARRVPRVLFDDDTRRGAHRAVVHLHRLRQQRHHVANRGRVARRERKSLPRSRYLQFFFSGCSINCVSLTVPSSLRFTVMGMESMTTVLSAACSSDTFASVIGVFRKASCTLPKTKPCPCADMAAARARIMVMTCRFILLYYFFFGFLFQ